MKRISKNLLGLVGGVAALALVVGTPSAWANTGPNFCLNSFGTDCLMQLDLGNTAIAPYPGPYVSIDVTIVGSKTLEFALQGLSQPSGTTTYHYYFGDLALDLLGSGFTGTFQSATDKFGNAVPSTSFTFGTGLVEDGFGNGKFGDASIDSGAGYVSALDTLVFDLTWTTLPIGVASFTDLLTQGFMELSEHGGQVQGGGASAAGHVFVATLDASGNPSTDAVTTGFAAWPNCTDQGTTDCTRVPEPASLALLGSGLVGIGILNRRRRRSAA